MPYDSRQKIKKKKKAIKKGEQKKQGNNGNKGIKGKKGKKGRNGEKSHGDDHRSSSPGYSTPGKSSQLHDRRVDQGSNQDENGPQLAENHMEESTTQQDCESPMQVCEPAYPRPLEETHEKFADNELPLSQGHNNVSDPVLHPDEPECCNEAQRCSYQQNENQKQALESQMEVHLNSHQGLASQLHSEPDERSPSPCPELTSSQRDCRPPKEDNNHFDQNDPYLTGHYGPNHTQGRSHHRGEQQAQSQIALQRKIQAYFQMLYDVYDYTIGMIEELEKHETHGKQIHNSGILSHLIPVNKKKPIHDVIGGIELELKCLQAQMKSLPPEVTDAAREKLVIQTIRWAASREAQDIPYGHVDHYCKNVLEILLFHAHNKLPNVDRAPKIKLTTEQVNEAMYQMAVQRHLGEKQDAEFAEDPTKEAKLRNKRQTEELRQGALRLTMHDPQLKGVLEEQGYVPDVSMDLV